MIPNCDLQSWVIGIDQPAAVITGATGGIGRWIALGLAQAKYHVILIARDRERGEATRAWIAAQARQSNPDLLIADLSLLAATRHAAKLIISRHPRIAILVNNAGIFDANRLTTSEGYERVLATNLLSPFVLTKALLPALLAGSPARIVNIGSSTSDRVNIDPDNLELRERWTMRLAYSQSKLALMMTTFALARRLEGTGVTANVVHPGLVASGLVRTGGLIGLVWRCMALIALREERGADSPLYASLAPEIAKISGIYLKDHRAALPNRLALDPLLVERVWSATESLAMRVDDGVQM